jgi:arylsulfatase A-like enzyme
VKRAKPNVLFFMTDQQHTNTLGCYGNDIIETPRIDQLAHDGVLFERHYVTIPLCVPSRASIWSSQYPHCNGVLVNDDGREVGLPEGIITFGDAAKAAGYRCGYIGKWHIGNEQKPQHGFTDAWWTHLRGSYEQELEESGQFRFGSDVPASRSEQRRLVPFEKAHDTVVADRTIEFIERHRDEPFVAICSMRGPHDPYTGPFDDRYDPADVYLPPTYAEAFENKPLLQKRGTPRQWFERWVGGSPDAINIDRLREIIARYWGLVHLIDLNVGRVMEALDDHDLTEDTIVVFMSDHGDMMGNHGLFAKGNFMYDDTTRVPLILSYQGSVPRGTRVDALTSTIDVVPTLLDLMGIPQPGPMQGSSVRHLWDYGHNQRNEVFMEIFESYSLWNPVLSVRTRRWKYNWYLSDIDELYDMEADPLEMNNLATDPNHRDTLYGLRMRIRDWLSETGDIRLGELAMLTKSYRRKF